MYGLLSSHCFLVPVVMLSIVKQETHNKANAGLKHFLSASVSDVFRMCLTPHDSLYSNFWEIHQVITQRRAPLALQCPQGLIMIPH